MECRYQLLPFFLLQPCPILLKLMTIINPCEIARCKLGEKTGVPLGGLYWRRSIALPEGVRVKRIGGDSVSLAYHQGVRHQRDPITPRVWYFRGAGIGEKESPAGYKATRHHISRCQTWRLVLDHAAEAQP